VIGGRSLAAEHQHAFEARTGGGSGRLSAVVRLRCADSDYRIRTLGQGIGDEQLQLAHLVAPRCQAGLVVPLDPEPGTTQRRAEPLHRF
jgi:hypothetical protein